MKPARRLALALVVGVLGLAALGQAALLGPLLSFLREQGLVP